MIAPPVALRAAGIGSKCVHRVSIKHVFIHLVSAIVTMKALLVAFMATASAQTLRCCSQCVPFKDEASYPDSDRVFLVLSLDPNGFTLSDNRGRGPQMNSVDDHIGKCPLWFPNHGIDGHVEASDLVSPDAQAVNSACHEGAAIPWRAEAPTLYALEQRYRPHWHIDLQDSLVFMRPKMGMVRFTHQAFAATQF